MAHIDPIKQREFAVEVVRRLREAGFDAYWAGGCVRDRLLNRTPYDYDVATSAHPEEITHVFKHRKTLAVGAAFGVMTVVGPRGAGQVEVTTFRQDVSYSDGRHPDRIAFSSPEEDAKRRDFTINGMFFDPLAERVVDFVGGQEDLQRRMVRAIGDARQRFTEDKLRMLRAIRFAAILDFELEGETLAAIREMADQIAVVSAERIAGEMRIVLVHPSRVRAARWLESTSILQHILPEAAIATSEAWKQTTDLLGSLENPTFPLALAGLLFLADDDVIVEAAGQGWKLARAEIDRLSWLLAHRQALSDARQQSWSKLQPILAHAGADELVALHAAQAKLGWIDSDEVAYASQLRQQPQERLDPPPLIDGQALIELGIPRGPVFAQLLKAARDAQLDGQVKDRTEAVAFVSRLWSAEQKHHR